MSSEWNSRVENKLDMALKDISDIKLSQATHNAVVENYMEKTKTIENTLAPIKTRVDMMSGAVKLITLLGILAGIVEVVLLVVRK